MTRRRSALPMRCGAGSAARFAHSLPAGQPADAILEAVKANNVELIVAGALEKEVVLRPFLGNVARRLVREARCSVMLFTKPEREPKPLRSIVFFVPDYLGARATRARSETVRLAEKEQCENLYVIRVYTTFDAARATLRANQAERPTISRRRARSKKRRRRWKNSSSQRGETEFAVEARCIRGNTGFAASDFVQAVEADLLVVPVEASDASDGLPAHIAWVTDVIPCNLWMIR